MATRTQATTPATVTPATVHGKTVALTSATQLDRPALLAAAIAAVDTSSATDTVAKGTLRDLALQSFRYHAAHLARDLHGVQVLPTNLKKVAQGLVWRDATGNDKPVKTDERTPGQTSLGQYLSKFAKVATDEVSGMAGLESLAVVDECATAIDTANKTADEADKRRQTANAVKLFGVWYDKLPHGDRAALDRVRELFAAGNGAGEHAATFAAALIANSGMKDTK